MRLELPPEEDYLMYKQFHSGEISYEEWTEQLENLYNIRHILNQEISHKALTDFTIRLDAKSTIRQLQDQGYEIVLLTGGFKTTAKSLALQLHIHDYLYVTDIDFFENRVNLINNGEEGVAKLQLALNYCKTKHTTLDGQWAVGDSSNDIPLFKVVERSFAFTWSNDEVKENATHLIDNLSDILKFT
jgi:phosphoserine phosphatase